MNHPLADPNNHAPEPSLDAEWDDGVVAVGPDAGPPGSVIPAGARVRPRGRIEPRPPRQRKPRLEPAVNIDPSLLRLELEEPAEPSRFEVNRIGEIVRLESAEVEEEGFVPERAEPAFVPAPTREQALRRSVSHEWGRASARPARGWIAVAGVGVGALLFGALALHSQLVGRDEAGRDGFQLTLEKLDEPEISDAFQFDRASVAQILDLVASFAAAEMVDEVLPLVRDGERLRDRIAAEWQPWGAPAGWRPDAASVWDSDRTEDREFGVLSGFRPDFNRLRAYFVREAGRIVIDWEATEAVSDVPIDDLAQGKGDGGLVRVWAKAGSFHTVDFPEESFRAVQLISPRQDRILWGYAARGGAADLAFAEFFDDGLIVEADTNTLPVTLRLAPAPSGNLPNQWEITEVLHSEWVKP